MPVRGRDRDPGSRRAFAYQRALEQGAWGFDNRTGPMELNIPAIKGVGDS